MLPYWVYVCVLLDRTVRLSSRGVDEVAALNASVYSYVETYDDQLNIGVYGQWTQSNLTHLNGTAEVLR